MSERKEKFGSHADSAAGTPFTDHATAHGTYRGPAENPAQGERSRSATEAPAPDSPLAILSRTFRPIEVPVHRPRIHIERVGVYMLVDGDLITYVGSSANVEQRLHQHAVSMRSDGSDKRFDRAMWVALPAAVHRHYEGAFIRALCPRDNGVAPSSRGHDDEILDGFGLGHLIGTGTAWRTQVAARARRKQPDADSVAARITAARKALSLSVPALAAKLGMCRAAVWKWENGSTAPTRTNIGEVATALGVSVEHLLIGWIQ